ncbi:MAG: flagellar biosynthesis protein FlgJ [Paracoccaceae bacterium]
MPFPPPMPATRRPTEVRPSEPDSLQLAAVAFEAAFLAEMLSHTGLGQTPSGFGGGAGEEAFGSLLVREQARLLAESGVLGLADAIRASLAKADLGRQGGDG